MIFRTRFEAGSFRALRRRSNDPIAEGFFAWKTLTCRAGPWWTGSKQLSAFTTFIAFIARVLPRLQPHWGPSKTIGKCICNSCSVEHKVRKEFVAPELGITETSVINTFGIALNAHSGSRTDPSNAPIRSIESPGARCRILCEVQISWKSSWPASKPGAPEMDFVFTVCDDTANESCQFGRSADDGALGRAGSGSRGRFRGGKAVGLRRHRIGCSTTGRSHDRRRSRETAFHTPLSRRHQNDAFNSGNRHWRGFPSSVRRLGRR